MDDANLLEDDILPPKNVVERTVEAGKYFVLSYFKDGKYIVYVILTIDKIITGMSRRLHLLNYFQAIFVSDELIAELHTKT